MKSTAAVLFDNNNFAKRDTGYNYYMNVGSWVDYFIVNEMVLDVDGYRLSSFLNFDPKSGAAGQLRAGPVWDK